MKFPHLSCLALGLITAGNVYANPIPVCVTTADELQSALTEVATNGVDDEIRLVAGFFDGDISVQWEGTDALTLGFGFDGQCETPTEATTSFSSLTLSAPNATLTVYGQNLAFDGNFTISFKDVVIIADDGELNLPPSNGPLPPDYTWNNFSGSVTISNGPNLPQPVVPETSGTISVCSGSQTACVIPDLIGGNDLELTGGTIDAVFPGKIFFGVPTVKVTATGPLTPASLGKLPDSSRSPTVLLPPGRHEIVRKHEGIRYKQIVKVIPTVRLVAEPLVAEGGTFTVTAQLLGPAAKYPVTIPYTVGGTAGATDHNAADGTFVIESGTSTTVTFETFDDDVEHSPDRTIVFRLGEPENAVAGPKPNARITVSDANLPPKVSLKVEQDGRTGSVVTQDGGEVTITAQVTDPNAGDSHTYSWAVDGFVSADYVRTENFFRFRPAGLEPGTYRASVVAADDGTPKAFGRGDVLLRVLAEAPALSTGVDSDDDGIDDLTEGFGDSDGDGIPDYLDPIGGANLVSLGRGEDQRYAQVPDGQRLRLGRRAQDAAKSTPLLTPDELAAAIGADFEPDSFENVGGLFDFEIADLPQAGATEIVLSLRKAIPENAVYRKYYEGIGWRTFVEDADNALASAPGEHGTCPSPGSDSYEPGLIAGYRCLQLTLEDGGPNDADGQADGRIQDPGGIARDPQASGGGGAAGGWLLVGLALAGIGRWSRRRASVR